MLKYLHVNIKNVWKILNNKFITFEMHLKEIIRSYLKLKNIVEEVENPLFNQKL